MAIPLPKVVSDTGPGGQIFTNYNAVNEAALKNRMQELQNQYYAPEKESEIGYRNALASKIPYEIENQKNVNKFYAPNMQSEMAFRNASTNKLNTMTPLEAQNQQNINDWYAREAQAKIDASKALSNYRGTGGIGSRGTGGKDLNDLSTAIKQENPNFTPEQIIDARNGYLEGRDTFSDGTPLPAVSGSIKGLLESFHKRRTDANQRNQQRYAATLEAIIKKSDANAKIATEYSGLIGKGEGSLEKASSLLGGPQSTRFQAFNNFVNVDVPTMAGEYMRQLGVNASDQQKALYVSVVNPVNWYKSPETALSQWNYFKSLAKTVGVTLAKSAYQTSNDLRNSEENESETPSSKPTLRYNQQTGDFEEIK